MSETTPEAWRPIPGHDGYEASDLGRIRSLDRVITVPMQAGGVRTRRMPGRVLRPGTDGIGRQRVVLGRGNCRLVHSLVAEAFLGPRPEGMNVLHGRGGIADNRVVNLSYGTQAKNLGPDRFRDGTDYNGEQNPIARLNWDAVDRIRDATHGMPMGRPGRRPGAQDGEPGIIAQLAAQFGVNRATVWAVVAGKTWRPESRRHAS